MKHAQLVRLAEQWLRRQGCRIVLSEQTADCGEVPDAIGWRGNCHSIVIECKVSRGDFLADEHKWARQKPHAAMGRERFYLTTAGLVQAEEIPKGWGLLEARRGEVSMTVPATVSSRARDRGLIAEMALLLASLRRVEVRIEPQTITEFLKWKNRMAAYNGGTLPKGLVPIEDELSITATAIGNS